MHTKGRRIDMRDWLCECGIVWIGCKVRDFKSIFQGVKNIFFIGYGFNFIFFRVCGWPSSLMRVRPPLITSINYTTFCHKKCNQYKYSEVPTILHAKSESPLLQPSKWIYKAKAKHKTSDTNQRHIICELTN